MGLRTVAREHAQRRATSLSVNFHVAGVVAAVFHHVEELVDLRMVHGFARGVGDEVLLGNVGDVLALLVFGEQVIEGLILAGGYPRGWSRTNPRCCRK